MKGILIYFPEFLGLFRTIKKWPEFKAEKGALYLRFLFQGFGKILGTVLCCKS